MKEVGLKHEQAKDFRGNGQMGSEITLTLILMGLVVVMMSSDFQGTERLHRHDAVNVGLARNAWI